MIEAKVVNRGNCMLCGNELTEDEGIFFCKECGYKIIDDNNKRKKELENLLNASVQNMIDQEIQKKPSLWWKCERCGKLIPYMADFCHECADEINRELSKLFDPQAENEGNCQSCNNYKNEYCDVLDMKPCYPENGCDYFEPQVESIEFIMPEATMHVDPIQDENIHAIDFAHGYNHCKNVMKKEIHKLVEDTMNGAAGEFIRGWNLALDKVLEVMESEDKDE